MAKSIINADDGSVSGVPGIKTSGGDENSLVIQSVGSDVVELNGTGLDLLTGAIKANGNSVIDTSGNIDATQVSVGGSTVIDTSGNIDATQVSVGGSTVIDSSGNVNAASEFTINGSSVLSGDSFTIPSGTTGERPASPELGMLRYNTDNSELEQYDGSEWSGIGGGAAGAELVATGSIPGAGTSVALLSDGTVEIVEDNFVSEEVGTISVFHFGNTKIVSSTYDSAAGKVVIAYKDSSDNHGKAVVGTVSGNSISFGSETEFISDTTEYVRVGYDSASGKVVVIYKDSNQLKGRARVGTVSGDSISFGGESTFANQSLYYTKPIFADGKIVFAWHDGSDNGNVIVGTVSGNSISFGSEIQFASNSEPLDIAYDSAADKIVISYIEQVNYEFYVIVGTIDGSSISFGTPVLYQSSNISNAALVYEPVAEKLVILYRDPDNSSAPTAAVGTVSGNSISFDVPIVFTSVNASGFSGVYDPAAGKIVIAYRNSNQGDRGELVVGTVSNNSISFDSPIVYTSNVSQSISLTYDSAAEKVVISWYDENSNGDAITYNPAYTGTNADDFIGFAQDSAADTDTVVLVATNQQIDVNQTGLTPQTTYYLDTDGSITTSDTGLPVAGFALDSNTLRVGG
jgi:hypothetical protein